MTTSVPRPGRPVRGSATGRPVMAALDLLGRRWTLRVLWELRDGALGFRPLQKRCDAMSSSVLQTRLTELQQALLVIRHPDGSYQLTDLGAGAYQALLPLTRWSGDWAAAIDAIPPLATSSHSIASSTRRQARRHTASPQRANRYRAATSSWCPTRNARAATGSTSSTT